MNTSELEARLLAWAPLVSSGYECPAAGQSMFEAAEALSQQRQQLEVEAAPSPYCEQCGSCGDEGCGCTHKCKFAFEHPEVRQRIEALEADNARLREALKPFADTGEFFDLETTGFADEDVLNLIVEDGHLIERIAVGAFRTAHQALGEG